MKGQAVDIGTRGRQLIAGREARAAKSACSNRGSGTLGRFAATMFRSGTLQQPKGATLLHPPTHARPGNSTAITSLEILTIT